MTTGVAAPIATPPTLPPEAARVAPGASIPLARTQVELRPSGALFWPERSLLCVGELHLGRAERLAREGGELQPPYESLDTLDRLEAEIIALAPRRVICLGDSFDDLAAAQNLSDEVLARIDRLAAGRLWTWIAGSHDPGPVALPGTHLAELRMGLLSFRHVALPSLAPEGGEVSAHFHPKALLNRRGARIARRCFMADRQRVILPAFGTHTGGLDARDEIFDAFMGSGARAYLTGEQVTGIARDRLG